MTSSYSFRPKRRYGCLTNSHMIAKTRLGTPFALRSVLILVFGIASILHLWVLLSLVYCCSFSVRYNHYLWTLVIASPVNLHVWDCDNWNLVATVNQPITPVTCIYDTHHTLVSTPSFLWVFLTSTMPLLPIRCALCVDHRSPNILCGFQGVCQSAAYWYHWNSHVSELWIRFDDQYVDLCLLVRTPISVSSPSVPLFPREWTWILPRVPSLVRLEILRAIRCTRWREETRWERRRRRSSSLWERTRRWRLPDSSDATGLEPRSAEPLPSITTTKTRLNSARKRWSSPSRIPTERELETRGLVWTSVSVITTLPTCTEPFRRLWRLITSSRWLRMMPRSFPLIHWRLPWSTVMVVVDLRRIRRLSPWSSSVRGEVPGSQWSCYAVSAVRFSGGWCGSAGSGQHEHEGGRTWTHVHHVSSDHWLRERRAEGVHSWERSGRCILLFPLVWRWISTVERSVESIWTTTLSLPLRHGSVRIRNGLLCYYLLPLSRKWRNEARNGAVIIVCGWHFHDDVSDNNESGSLIAIITQITDEKWLLWIWCYVTTTWIRNKGKGMWTRHMKSLKT